MAEMKKRKKKTGAAGYTVFLILWIILLGVIAFYVLKNVWRFAVLYEESQITPVVNAYVDTLSEELWDSSIAETVASMPHEFQTDEECAEVIRNILSGEITYHSSVGTTDEGTARFDLLCGDKLFGQITLTQKEMPEGESPIVQKLAEYLATAPWEITAEEFYFSGLYTSFEITVPSDYTVLLNDKRVSSDYIVETGIHYDVLEDYYEEYEGLPTKVKYHVDDIFGQIQPKLLDANGEETQIDPERNDSQFIEPVTDELYSRMYEFGYAFASRYMEFSAGTTEMQWLYDRLVPYIKAGSELDERLLKAWDSYLGWQHNEKFRFGTASLNEVIPLGNGYYVLDITADATNIQPKGTVHVERNMKVFVRMVDDDVRAYSVEDY